MRSCAAVASGVLPGALGRSSLPRLALRHMAAQRRGARPKREPSNAINTNPRWSFHPHVRKMDDHFPIREIVKIGRHTKVLKGGRLMSYSALVLIGSGSGSAGLGYGKALKVPDAIQAANLDAEKNVVHVRRFNGTRNVTDTTVRLNGAKIIMRPLPAGQGVKGSWLSAKVCEAFGLTDVSIKLIGPRSKNLATRVRGIFQAIESMRDPEYEAFIQGKQLFNKNKVWRRKEVTRIL